MKYPGSSITESVQTWADGHERPRREQRLFARPLAIAWVFVLAVLLAACSGSATPAGHRIVSNPGTPPAVTPLAPAETPLPGTPGEPAPLSTLPSRPGANATVTLDPSRPTPDAGLYSRLIYTYTVGIKPVKLVLDIAPDGKAGARFGKQRRAGSLPAEKMSEIAATLRSSNFFTLQDEYIPARTCCDLPSHEITVFTADGRQKTVYVLGHAPDALGPLIDALGGIWQSLPVVQD